MKKQVAIPHDASASLKGARVAVLGYGAPARDHACALRAAGNSVSIGMRFGGMSWVRARSDGFHAAPASTVIEDADVVVVLVPDDEHASVYWHAIAPHLAPGALIVFGRGLPLEVWAFDPPDADVVFVTGDRGDARASCRVAVHRDVTGRALERAIAYARAAFGADAAIGTTAIAAEVDAELAALEVRAGGAAELLAEIELAAARLRDNHAPEEARLAFYDGLRAMVEARLAPSSERGHERGSATSLIAGQGPRRGVA